MRQKACLYGIYPHPDRKKTFSVRNNPSELAFFFREIVSVWYRGHSVDYFVDENESVRNLKKRAADHEGLQTKEVDLIHHGKILSGDATLCETTIFNHPHLNLYRR